MAAPPSHLLYTRSPAVHLSHHPHTTRSPHRSRQKIAHVDVGKPLMRAAVKHRTLVIAVGAEDGADPFHVLIISSHACRDRRADSAERQQAGRVPRDQEAARPQ